MYIVTFLQAHTHIRRMKEVVCSAHDLPGEGALPLYVICTLEEIKSQNGRKISS